MKFFKSVYQILALSIITVIFIGSFYIDDSNAIKDKVKHRVEELLSKMTLEEKVGQMTQITLEVVSKSEGTVNQKFELDKEKLREAITKYHVGSILNVYNVAHTVQEWHSIINEIQNVSQNETRMKIPVLYGIDAIHGATYTKGATLFPQALGMASTWNPELVMYEGEITSKQVKACGIPWNFYPVMDIGRQPLWSRLWETYGEDVYLASELGKMYIEGAQGNDLSASDKLATCLKHFVGYSFPLNGKDRTPAWIPERILREYFLPTFEAGIKAGAPTVMVNSSEINGIPTHSNYHLITEILKGELNFKGFVVSDWADINNLYQRDRIASSQREAVKMAVLAGVDMSMVPNDYSFYNHLLALVKDGEVPLSRIDDAVSRILTVKVQLGLFENPYPVENDSSLSNDKYNQICLDAAHQSVVMVKNQNNILPLPKNKKVLITGPTADKLSVLNGGWTLTWQGNEEKLYPQSYNTIKEAIEETLGESNCTFVEGTSFDQDINSSEALMKAADADYIIVCLGEPAYCETPGNIEDLTLPANQLNLVHKLKQTGKPIILVMIEGRPRVIKDIVDEVDAILISFLPGMEGGDAVRDIIFGMVNPSGKLPITYPDSPNDLMCYDHKPMEEYDQNHYTPQWPFGFGLSYSTFEYSNLKLDKEQITSDQNINVFVEVTNTGSTKGMETVQMYICDLYGSVSRPVKQLKGFEKIELNPGVSKLVSFVITPDDLSFIGRDNKRIIEPGKFEVYIDTLKASFILN